MSRITVKELRDALSHFDDDLEVHIGYSYGDYWKTMVAPGASRVETGMVVYSGYHQMDRFASEEEERQLIDELSADCDEGHISRESSDPEVIERIRERTPRTVLVIR